MQHLLKQTTRFDNSKESNANLPAGMIGAVLAHQYVFAELLDSNVGFLISSG